VSERPAPRALPADAMLLDRRLRGERQYWIERLSAGHGGSGLCPDLARRGEGVYATVDLAIDRSVDDALTRLSGGSDFLRFAALLAALKACLYRYTQNTHVRVATPARRSPEHAAKLGNVVIAVDEVEDVEFKHFLLAVRQTLLDAYAHQRYPFEQLWAELSEGRDARRWLPCDVAARCQEIHDTLPELGWDLVMECERAADVERVRLRYRADVFRGETIAGFARALVTLLRAGLDDPTARLSALDVLHPTDRRRLVEWNETAGPIPHAAGVHGLFESQVKRRPTAPAVWTGTEVWTYGALNARANQIAWRLRRAGVSPGDRVGLMLDRSPHMIAGMLGVLKAGAAYLPLDPGMPRERLDFMVSDATAAAILVDPRHRERIGSSVPHVVVLDARGTAVAGERVDDPGLDVRPDDLAYVIYTSGSTGQPKGVLIAHGGAINFADVAGGMYGLGPGERVLQSCSISFDVSVEEIFPCLARGGGLVLRPEATHDSVAGYLARCAEWGITFVSLPTTFWHDIVAALETGEAALPPTLRAMVFGTERVLPERVASWQRLVEDRVELFHTYGPTEATVIATAYRVPSREGEFVNEVPIGRPIRNAQAYVVDGHGRLAPVGAVGELWVAGIGLARGYLDRAPLTAERFVGLQIGGSEPKRVYRTGDLARHRWDGNLEFRGRLDGQVKVRGFRVETGEVQSTIARFPGVRDAVVVPREDASRNTALAAYVVFDARRPPAAGVPGRAQLEAEHLKAVRDAFDARYKTFAHGHRPGLYLEGWTSGSGQPVRPAEMADWADRTAARIRALGPRRILEIGCGGSALMLSRLAPASERYLACDGSEGAIAIARRQMEALGQRPPRLEFNHGDATDLGWIAPGSVDAVLLVATVQHFPGVEYLVDALSRAVDVCAPGGFVFVSDVRSLPLLEAFHAWAETADAAPDTPADVVAAAVAGRLIDDHELAVDPALFLRLPERIPRIHAVDVLLKDGEVPEEFAKFGYDVVLQVGGGPAPGPEQLRDWRSGGASKEAIRRAVEELGAGRLRVTGVPDARIETDLRRAELLRRSGPGQTVAGLQRAWAARPEAPAGPSVAEWAAMASQLGCVMRLAPCLDDRSRVDVIFQKSGSPAPPFSRARAGDGTDGRAWSELANDPLLGRYSEGARPALRDFLRATLPPYMVPSVLVPVRDLPLTHNGKTDVRALPPAAAVVEAGSRAFVPPEGRLEDVLSRLFREVLDVRRVGRTDNFFDLGGHSLIALRLMAAIEDRLEVEVPLSTLYDAPVLADFAREVQARFAERAATGAGA
jgi:amino acid adenylation domain-containing protein